MSKINTMVIAAGGEGKRIAQYFDSIKFNNTKTLFPVKGQPLIKYLIDMAFTAGITKVFLLASHYEDELKQFVDKYYYDKDIFLINGCEEGRTGGVAKVLSTISTIIDSPFIFSDGDILFESQLLRKILNTDCNERKFITCVVSSEDMARTHSKFIISRKRIVDIKTRLDGDIESSDYCSMGLMLINPKMFNLFPNYKNMNDLDVVVKNIFLNDCDSIDFILYKGRWLSIHNEEDIQKTKLSKFDRLFEKMKV